jgi:hypothetical protein
LGIDLGIESGALFATVPRQVIVLKDELRRAQRMHRGVVDVPITRSRSGWMKQAGGGPRMGAAASLWAAKEQE